MTLCIDVYASHLRRHVYQSLYFPVVNAKKGLRRYATNIGTGFYPALFRKKTIPIP